MSQEQIVELNLEEEEPLGATPNERMIITKIQKGTVADGKLQVGDQIIKINGTVIRDNRHFYVLMRTAFPVAALTIVRDQKRIAELSARLQIPAEREKNITRREGYLYELVKIEWKAGGGQKLGLGIKHYQNRVLVSKCDPGSLSAGVFLVGDHIVDLDGVPVTDKDVARGILVKTLQAKGVCSMVIERPESVEAKHWVTQALAASTVQPPSVQMNSDVRNIAKKERGRLVEKDKLEVKSILKAGRAEQGVAIDDKLYGHVIASDNEGKALRPVKK